jgi:hypothetical protein
VGCGVEWIIIEERPSFTVVIVVIARWCPWLVIGGGSAAGATGYGFFVRGDWGRRIVV